MHSVELLRAFEPHQLLADVLALEESQQRSRGALHPVRDVLLGDQLACCQQRIQERAADVVEVDVDPARAEHAQASGDVFVPVIDGVRDAELLFQPAALLGPSCDGHHMRPEDPRDLDRGRACRARGGRDHHGVIFAHRSRLDQAEVSGHSVDAGHTQPTAERDVVRHLAKRQDALSIRERVILPSKGPPHAIAWPKARVA
ncbi:hypothetical protein WME73_48555 [Sorangium sp. So ce302]